MSERGRLTADEIAEMRESHVDSHGDCWSCVESWPCDAVRLLDHIAAVAAERDAAMSILEIMDIDGKRQGIHDWRDAHVRILCEEYGYGAVMDAAARLWRAKDPVGAFLVGPCVGTVRAVIRAEEGR